MGNLQGLHSIIIKNATQGFTVTVSHLSKSRDNELLRKVLLPGEDYAYPFSDETAKLELKFNDEFVIVKDLDIDAEMVIREVNDHMVQIQYQRDGLLLSDDVIFG